MPRRVQRGLDDQTWACPQEAHSLGEQISSPLPPRRLESDQRLAGLGVGLGAETHTC